MTFRTLLTKKPPTQPFDGLSEIDDAEKPYPLRQLVTRRRVLLAVTNYATFRSSRSLIARSSLFS